MKLQLERYVARLEEGAVRGHGSSGKSTLIGGCYINNSESPR